MLKPKSFYEAQRARFAYQDRPDELSATLGDNHLLVCHPERPAKVVGLDGNEVDINSFNDKQRGLIATNSEVLQRVISRLAAGLIKI